MENSIAIGDWIMHQIETKGITKSLVYQGAGITQSGFLKMIRNNSIRVDVFIRICEAMAVHPCEYFDTIFPKEYKQKELSEVEEPREEYRISDINDKDSLIDFQAKQIEQLTETVLNQSQIINKHLL